MAHPLIIQGGMGIGISNWSLARAVSLQGQLGVVSGTALNTLFIRRLQDGDRGGHLRRAMHAFPLQDRQRSLTQQILKDYFVEAGERLNRAYKLAPVFTLKPSLELLRVTVVANFCEVWLAKEGHGGVVGFNLLEKVQLPNLASLYGALLAGVDYVLMGAGIPREIPGALDALSEHREAALSVPVQNVAHDEHFKTVFNPRFVFSDFTESEFPSLRRPFFLPIIASAALGLSLAKKSTGRVDGFIVEGPTAGGHNAPPRGASQLNEGGEPIYGPKDEVDLEVLRRIGLPFWMAGSFGTSEKLAEARSWGAAGVQLGTAFAFCEESGLEEGIKKELLDRVSNSKNQSSPPPQVFTDPRSSPTGFPFKAIRWEKSLSEKEKYESRPRICDLGYLRHLYKKSDGALGSRCPAEPVDNYVKKGGALEDTQGRKCLCNALFANVGHAQFQTKTQYTEETLITAGDDFANLGRFLKAGKSTYSVHDILKSMLESKSLLSESEMPSTSIST